MMPQIPREGALIGETLFGCFAPRQKRQEVRLNILSSECWYSCVFTAENTLKMNNQRRKGHRCAEVVHYGSGIIAFFFLPLAPIVMKSWPRLTLNDRLRHGSITPAWVRRGAGGGEGGGGGGGGSIGCFYFPFFFLSHWSNCHSLYQTVQGCCEEAD